VTDKDKKHTQFQAAVKHNNGVKRPTKVPRPSKPPVQKKTEDS
jgi:hypothetical protein